MRVTAHTRWHDFPALPVAPCQFRLQFLDAARQPIDFTLFPDEFLFNAFELRCQLPVAFILRFNDPLLAMAQNLLLVGMFGSQALDVMERGWLAFIIEVAELSQCGHGGLYGAEQWQADGVTMTFICCFFIHYLNKFSFELGYIKGVFMYPLAT